jgi:hypothetical protein
LPCPRFDSFPIDMTGSHRNHGNRYFFAGFLSLARRDELAKKASTEQEIKKWFWGEHN